VRAPIVHLYLDISGSMTACLPYLSAACRDPFKRGELKIFRFLDCRISMQGPQLNKVPLKNTWGPTSNAVLEHMTGISVRQRPKVILIATDGYGGARSHRPDSESRSHPGSRCPDGFRARRRSPAWVHEIIQLPKS